jgi:hypothetical protein
MWYNGTKKYSFNDIQLENPNISFPLDGDGRDEIFIDMGYFPIKYGTAPTLSACQVLVEKTPVFDSTNNLYTIDYDVSTIVPTEITGRQCRLQLVANGTYDTVVSAIANLSQTAQIEWQYAAVIQRDNPLVGQLATLLNMDSSAIDTFFINASQL